MGQKDGKRDDGGKAMTTKKGEKRKRGKGVIDHSETRREGAGESSSSEFGPEEKMAI